jgi:hypothetical protein
MKLICARSGLEFEVSHFPGTFHSPEIFHPIFHIPQKRLLSYTGKWASGELTRTDSYLLFLAILASSDRVEFRIPAFRNEHTDAIVANNMEFLVRTVIKINTVTHPSAIFPQFTISPDTRYLQNVYHWIEIWDENYKEFLSGKFKDIDNRKLVHREAALQRMIKNPHKKVSEYSAQIADWASVAGSFPTFLTRSPYTSLEIPISEYWKSIISKATRDEQLYSIPANDLQELLTHCEDNIPAGSIYSNSLFRVLRSAQAKQKNFLGLGDLDAKTSYTILTDTDTAEAANMRALIDSAPDEEPRIEQYPTKFAYLKAKLRWDMAKKYGNGKE